VSGRRCAAWLVVAACAAAPAAAHDRTVSYSSWDIDGPHARVAARLTALDVSRLPWGTTAGAELEHRLGDYLTERLTLRADGQPCPVSRAPTRLATTTDHIEVAWEVTCPSPHALQLHSEVLLDVAPSHLHFARVRLGKSALERVLSDAERTWTIGDTGLGGSSAAFLLLGMRRILTGSDHLFFLLGLLLLGGGLRDVVRIVAGFTIAHSLTLALAVFGFLRPPRAPVEALIGLSIALVAAENLWLAGGRPPLVRWALAAVLLGLAAGAAVGAGSVPALTLLGLAVFGACYLGLLQRAANPVPLRALLAFVFGLVHGFGFAGALLEAEPPSERVAGALFGFNAGVELGQVAVVLALWSLLRLTWRYRDGSLTAAAVEYGSAVILAVGVAWFVGRSYG
jgi:hypothetical protein